MELKGNILSWGASVGIPLSKKIAEEEGFKIGEEVLVKISKVKPDVKITKSDGKTSAGFVKRFLMFEGQPNLDVFIIEEDKSEIIPFSIIEKIEEIEK